MIKILLFFAFTLAVTIKSAPASPGIFLQLETNSSSPNFGKYNIVIQYDTPEAQAAAEAREKDPKELHRIKILQEKYKEYKKSKIHRLSNPVLIGSLGLISIPILLFALIFV